ncbi:LuxE/PaaK family acyltransferase [Anaerocolumna jejuensis]|uniref:LuxE/PaaK family acyltransferase n=1 Tax=Anaerocolumna jejuensis TaxID=259063 RepID=UPI003F7C0CD7
MRTFFQDLRDNLVDQYLTCPAYMYLCDSQGFNPTIHLNSIADVEEAPFIATTMFKKSAQMFTNLLRVPLESVDKWTVSSSTSGDPSIVGRRACDLLQLEKFSEMDRNVFRPDTEQDIVFYPEPEVMKKYRSEVIYGIHTESFIGNVLDVYHFKENTVFVIKPEGDDLTIDMEGFIKALKEHDGLDHYLSIRGSTPLLYSAVKALKETMNPFHLGSHVLVHTGGGGWDGKKGTVSVGTDIKKQDFVECVSDFLGIPEENFIDSYSFTENCFLITGHYSKEYKDYLYHIPSWGKVMIRDMKTLKPLSNPGDKGFIQMLNAYGTSTYAGASVLVDDIGEILSMDECPDCKSNLMTIKIIGRVKGAEAKGCGATLNVNNKG